ncbi:MAG: transporter permease, partial [Rhodospirillales bacterium]|nr:transporter permease [Rhodospirillales bacterium]
MTTTRRTLLSGAAGTAALGGLPFSSARAQAANTIKIGVLNDQSGTYRDISGPYGVECTRQAVAEFGAQGFNVEVIVADHQNRPDVGVNISRQWYDQGVDMILDVPTSSVGLAVNTVAREKNKAYINTGSATSDLTGTACSPNTMHWAYDSYMLSRVT